MSWAARGRKDGSRQRTHAGTAARVAILALVLAVSGCASSGPRDPFAGGSGGGGGSDRPLQVVVENHNWSDLAIYVEVRGSLHRLGTVGSANERRFRVPRGLVTGLDNYRFAARLMGGTYWWTPEFTLSPGSELTWQVGTSEATSHYSVRR